MPPPFFKTMRDISDEEARKLSEGAARGNRASMQELYGLFGGLVGGVCHRYLSDPDDVCDAVQNTFVAVLSSISRFEFNGLASLKSWLRRIAVNESLKIVSQHTRFAQLDDNPQAETLADEHHDNDIDNIDPETLLALINRLPEGCRTVLNLYVFEGKSHREIAKILNISEGTSASQYLRAKARLRALILEHLNQSA